MNAVIAQYLNVVESAIVKFEEWANVLFVVVRGIGARFVSKKTVKTMNGSEKQISWANQIKADFNSLESTSQEHPLHTEIGPLPWLMRLETKMPEDRTTINARRVLNAINNIEDASWWIENRSALTAPSFKSAFGRLGRDLGVELVAREKKNA